MPKGISRREFLKGAAAMGAAATMGGLRAEEARAAKGVFLWANGSEARSLDPARAITTGDSLARSWANGLLRFKPGLGDPSAYELDLAEKWDSSNGGKTYTFQLRKGVQAHHGAGELTSADVKWSLERLRDKRLTSIFRGRYEGIDGIETPDKYTVRFHLKEPDGLFLSKMMNFRGGYILSRGKATDDVGTNYMWSPVGTGPFQVVQVKPKEAYIFERHEKYFRGTPKIRRYEFRIIPDINTRILGLRRGELDAIYLATLPKRLLDSLKSDPNISVDIPDSDYAASLHFNLRMKPMDDIRVRKAIAYAINRKEIADLFRPMARELYSVIAPACVGGLKPEEVPAELRYDYDPNKAKALLAEAGYRSGLQLETAVSPLPHIQRPIQVIQQHLAQVGIQLKVNVVEQTIYLRGSRQDKYPFVSYGGKRFPHAYDHLFEWYHSKSDVTLPTRQTNISHYGNIGGSVDKLIEEMGRISDTKRQVELAKQAQIQILKDLPAYPFYTPLVGFAHRKNVKFGFKFEDSTVFSYYITEQSEVA
ncbi:MAG: twin-arginine translocation signal domain-containing protein [Candidatus Tectomicrobia bacterium]|uniref:Twin-arginine translocation signal domain-containing protein n=1 Tax=Tectimicrobiota bacterium TaxID=2528274 RepID=A0A932I141_UNCTE|nr:twin-arginine translocation signal domain-containing protein [Candidatus Tectomicrobia bacterium]